MICRSDHSVAERELQARGPYDTAIKGSSALLAALLRNIIAEIAIALDLDAAAIFNDFKNLFDTMDLAILMEEAIVSNFPLPWLVLDLYDVVSVIGVSIRRHNWVYRYRYIEQRDILH